MKKIIDVVIEWLTEDEWKFDNPNENLVIAGVKGENGNFRMFFSSDEDPHLFRLVLIPGFSIPENKRLEIAEFVTRANYGIQVGKFELDFDDGEVRYSAGLDLGGDCELTTGMVRAIMGRCASTLDRYTPGFMRILYAGLTPKEAIEEIEEG